ncbi:uL30 family ribosomal protein [Candidatus Woesearchaeota archaeon]|nr:uL30 family ribosomal protein [Candidatus Woesearchaeota archaeon]
MSEKIAVILIRSEIGHQQEVKDTLKMLNFRRKNNCVVLDKKPENLGMIKKIKDVVTWGEISEEVLKEIEKRKKGKVYCLHPPRKGYGRKGIKIPFKVGGGLGYRGDKINDLIKRML